jgi:Fe-S oxidoreductase
MLTSAETLIFFVLALLAVGAFFAAFGEIRRIIARGQGRLYLDHLWGRAIHALGVYITQRTTLKTRRVSSLIHWAIVLGFTWFFLVNLVEVLYGIIPGFTFPYSAGALGDLYLLISDIASVAVIAGVVYFILRRFALPNKAELKFRGNVLLVPSIQAGAVNRDSLIVAVFILIHVGFRFLGSALLTQEFGYSLWTPFASAVGRLLFAGVSGNTFVVLEHLFWWISIGSILLFLPYFAYSKHAHLFMAPVNELTKPNRPNMGTPDALDFEDESVEQFGAERIEHLTQTALVDAYACIMCNRCQDVCPAYITGKELSPSALEVNKRAILREEGEIIAGDGASAHPLMGWAISESAVWACTTCAACVEICPVGNEPMLDILDIRRDAVLMRGEFPAELQGAFKGMERQGNPWQSTESRLKWAAGLDVPTVDEHPDFDVLYWVGCAAAYDPRSQITARALVKVMQSAGVNFAVLGERESCTGDTARRAGREDLYQEMAKANIETLNEVAPKRIVVTCPHCLQNLANDYQQFGGHYEVIHHTQLIDELIAQGRLPESARKTQRSNVTFHDPCYLGRQNGVTAAPRNALSYVELNLVEMGRNRENSLCCGAGGAQFWKEEEPGEQAVSVARYQEAVKTGADTVAVGCPFCMQMFESAKSSTGGAGPAVKDVVELIAEGM